MYRIKITDGVVERFPMSKGRGEKVETLGEYLQCPIKIERTTFGQIMEIIAREREFMQKAFNISLYGRDLGRYIDATRMDLKQADLIRLEVYWDISVFQGELGIYPCFHGYGEWPVTEGCDEEPHEGGVAIEFTHPARLRDIQIVLDQKGKIELVREIGDRSQVEFVESFFRVHDVLHAILDEISWQYPQEESDEEDQKAE